MPRTTKTLARALVAAFVACGSAAAQDPVERRTVEAEFVGLEGESLGRATLTQAPVGVLIRVELEGLPEGPHGFHIHQTGACEPPFESAGEHFDPAESPHGHLALGGPEAGDLPNLHVPAGGALVSEMFNPLVSLKEGSEASLLDEDGSALVVHAEADDYETQPTGSSGDPVACAVVSD